jgi:DNA helicase-2/ATP-dependent DNA helicase PcrA
MLNPEQESVANHLDGPMRVGAVAGSGKTTALIERFGRLVESGVRPHRILVISFSRAAKDEVAKRLVRRVPGQNVEKCARTFHSIGLDIYKTECGGQAYIDNTGLLWLKAMTKAYRSMGIRPEKKVLKTFASYVKNEMLGTSEILRRLGKVDPRMIEAARGICDTVGSKYPPEDVIDAFYRAERIREVDGIHHQGATRRFVTFDDMIYKSAIALQTTEVRERWAARWDYVLQDEAQDENIAQASIAEALCRDHRNYMVVGDPSQCIYQWRGASPKKILHFDEEWPGAKTIVMHRNYRSGIEIVDLANKVIESMPVSSVITDDMGVPPEITSERNTHAHVAYHRFLKSDQEAEGIAANIVAHHEQGNDWKDQAILVRQNFMTLDIELAMCQREIPYKLLASGASFFDLKETKVILGYLRMLDGRGNKDDFANAILFPTRGVSRAFVNTVSEVQETMNMDWLDALRSQLAGAPRGAVDWLEMIDRRRRVQRDAIPEKIVQSLIDDLELEDWFSAEGDADADGGTSSSNLTAVSELACRFGSLDEMLDILDQMVAHRKANIRKRDVVILSTVHRAKGREWPVVYIPQLAMSLFPTSSGDGPEERRVFYVACTRAMDELWLSGPLCNYDGDAYSESQFVVEARLKTDKTYQPGRVIKEPEPIGTQMGLGL